MYVDSFMDVSIALADIGEHHGAGGFTGRWADKHWMNTPGPLYCGETDNCGTGPLAAPNNVQVDAEGYEVIFRQPVNRYELCQVARAAGADPFAGYGADGDTRWSYQELRTWWAERRALEQELDRWYAEQIALEGDKDYVYFAGLGRWRD